MEINKGILEKLEQTLDTVHPEDGEIKIEILGYGEISLVFTILDDPAGEVAYKRLPIFSTEEQVEKHIEAYNEYNKLLRDIGLGIPDFSAEWVYMNEKKDKISLFCAQKRVDPDSVGNRIIQNMSEKEIQQFVLLLMRDMKKVWEYNLENKDKGLQLGLDGQISNSAIKNFVPGEYSINADTELIYLDTSTPMYRIDGEDTMEAELFLTSAPPGLRKLLKIFFLKEVLDRYYDWREVTIDLLANFYKEQKSEVIPGLIDVINEFFASEAEKFNIKPITAKEVKKYYKSDKFIWVLFQNLRLFHRFIKTKILRRKYDFYLPEKIIR